MSGVTDIRPEMANAIAARMAELRLDKATLIERSGVTRQGLGPLLKGRVKGYQDRLKFPVCAALGWSPDSIDRLLRGEDPIELVTPGGEVAPRELRDLSDAVARLAVDLAALAERVGRLESQPRSRRGSR